MVLESKYVLRSYKERLLESADEAQPKLRILTLLPPGV